MTITKEVFTVMLFDKNREYLDETSDLPSYDVAKAVGEAVMGVSSEVEYFSIEKYFKRVHKAGKWEKWDEETEPIEAEIEIIEVFYDDEEIDDLDEEDGIDYGNHYRKRF